MAIFAAGCAPSPKKDAKSDEAKKDGKKKEEEKDPLTSQTINLGKGGGTFQGENRQPDGTTKRQPLWDVEWESSQAQPGEDGQAVLKTVRGRLFTNGKATTFFEADGARVDDKQQLLILRGNVKVRSIEGPADESATGKKKAITPEGTLTCNQIRYEAKDPKRKVIKAQGNVVVVGKAGTIGPTPELWATEDLSIVATPNMFDLK